MEGEFSEVRKKLREMCIEALRDAYGDLLCLLVRYRDTRPGIRCAEVSGDVSITKYDQRSRVLGGGK